MKRTLGFAYLAVLVIASLPAFTQPPQKKPPVGTLGTQQMQGGDGLFGKTYTVANSGGYIYNITIASAEFSTARHNINAGTTLLPKADEKLMILHLLAQNPVPRDAYFGSNFITFSTVAKDGKTRNHNESLRLISAKEQIGTTLKPGQKFPEEILAACLVPATGPVPKLILNMGRKGTNETVIRYSLGKAPNTVKPLPAPYADPADPTGASARSEIPAKPGTVYTAGRYDVRLDSVAYQAGPIGDVTPGDGKRLLVATVTVTNRTWRKDYFKDSLAATLWTDDDEKTTEYALLKGKRDERFEGRQVDPDEVVTMRLAFRVPRNAKATRLKLAEIMDNSNSQSHALLYDLSGIQ